MLTGDFTHWSSCKYPQGEEDLLQCLKALVASNFFYIYIFLPILIFLSLLKFVVIYDESRKTPNAL